MLFNSAELLADSATLLYKRLPKPIKLEDLVNAQIALEIIGAIRLLILDPERVITGADITHFQEMGGRDHLDPTLSGSPIREERPYSTSKLR